MPFEAYKVAVRLSLIENVTSGLTRLSANFARAGMQADELQKRLDRIAKTTLIGGAMTATGGFMLKSLQAPLDAAKQFQTQQAKFSALGLGDKALDDATKFAKSMNIIGSSARDNLKLLSEVTGITGDLNFAKEVTPLLAKSQFAIKSVMDPDKAAAFESQFAAAIKTTELRGAIIDRATGHVDPEQFKRVYNMMGQAYVASNGLVKPSDYLAGIKTGGVSTKLMNDESFFFGLGHFMQESGGSRVGTASMSQFQQWIMGRMPQRVAEDMAKLGLLDPHALHYGKTGHITRVDVEGLLRSKEFVEAPFKYMNSVVVPLLEKRGFHGNDLNLKLASLFGMRTSSNLADQFVREAEIADRYITRSKQAANWDQLAAIGAQTMQGKEVDLEAKWNNLMLQLGDTILPAAIKGLEGLNGALKDLTKFADEHPHLTTFAMAGLGVMGVLATLGGTLTLVKAGLLAFTPLLGGGSGLAGALGRVTPLLGGVGPAATAAAIGLTKLLGAFGVGYAVGTGVDWLIGKGITAATGREESLGTLLYGLKHNEPDLTAPVWSRPGSAAGAGRGYVNPGAANQPSIHVNVTNQLDGEDIRARITQDINAKPARGPQGLNPLNLPMSPSLSTVPGA